MRVRINNKRYRINDAPKLNKNKKHFIDIVVDRLEIKNNMNERLSNSLEIVSKISNGQIIINDGQKDLLFSQNYACIHCNLSYDLLQPSNFSFNSPFGACSHCDGIGTKTELDIDKIIPDTKKSLIDGAVMPIGPQPNGKGIGTIIKRLSTTYNFSFTTPWAGLPQTVKNILLNGIKSVDAEKRENLSFYSINLQQNFDIKRF